MAKWVLITGGAKRIGAEIAQYLHDLGYSIAIHYNHSESEAKSLQSELLAKRDGSALLLQGDLATQQGIENLIEKLETLEQSIDILINNASSFIPNSFETTDFSQCQQMLTTNLVSPYLLSLACARKMLNKGVIINLLDIHGKRPLSNHGLYSISKAALEMATLSLAQELAPNVRVNGVAPGAIIWPEQSNASEQANVMKSIPLGRAGNAKQVATAVGFLIEAEYITGQVIAVDGGRSAAGFTGAQ